MINEAKPTSNWDGDATGLLTGYAHRLQRRRLLLVAATTTGTVVAASAIGFVGWNAYLQRLSTEYQHFGLTCSDVRELLPEYKANRLDAKRSDLLEKHVRKCSNCKELISELRQQV